MKKYSGPERREKRISVKKTLAAIGTLEIFGITIFCAIIKPSTIPDLLYPLSAFVLLLFGIRSASMLIDKKMK